MVSIVQTKTQFSPDWLCEGKAPSFVQNGTHTHTHINNKQNTHNINGNLFQKHISRASQDELIKMVSLVGWNFILLVHRSNESMRTTIAHPTTEYTDIDGKFICLRLHNCCSLDACGHIINKSHLHLIQLRSPHSIWRWPRQELRTKRYRLKICTEPYSGVCVCVLCRHLRFQQSYPVRWCFFSRSLHSHLVHMLPKLLSSNHLQ